jgi:hypothetical protein
MSAFCSALHFLSYIAGIVNNDEHATKIFGWVLDPYRKTSSKLSVLLMQTSIVLLVNVDSIGLGHDRIPVTWLALLIG